MFGELKKELIKMTDIKKEAYDIGLAVVSNIRFMN
jgi:hypothetical protein